MAQELPTQAQYELVYQGIVEVARRCDGAQSLDGVGFNGQDTHFGRRIAAVPFAQWTEDVKAEAARISNTYKVQIQTYTGVDVGTLPVVQEALGRTTNHKARNDARAYENRAKHLAGRTIDVVDGRLGIRWANGDPDFSAFLKLAQALPGRRWDGARKVNVVDASPQVETFINEHDFTITEAAQALLAQPAPAPKVDYQVTLDPEARRKVIIRVSYNPALVEDIKVLPGRSWDAPTKSNRADAHPAVLALAGKWGLNVHPDAKAACEAAQDALAARQASDLSGDDVATVLAAVSGTNRPEDLPAVFVEMLRGVLNDA